MNYKFQSFDDDSNYIFEITNYIKPTTKIKPQWEKIKKYSYFTKYENFKTNDELLQTDFPFYLTDILNKFSEQKKNLNYFSSFFSKNIENNKLEPICEAASFLTSTTKQLPPILLSNNFISQLINISLRQFCDKSTIMALSTLSNIAENSFESSEILISMNILQTIFDLAANSNTSEIKTQALFLISSLAKYDHGDEIANSIFSFFYSSPLNSRNFFNTSLRTFSFLSKHHVHLFDNKNFIQTISGLICDKSDVTNSQCFTILSKLIHYNPVILDELFEYGIFSKIYDILSDHFLIDCICFLESALIVTRKYDDIILGKDFLELFNRFLHTEKIRAKESLISLIGVALSKSSDYILFQIYDSEIFVYLFDFVLTMESENNISEQIILGIGRLMLIFESCDTNKFEECREEFCELLEKYQLNNNKANIDNLITQFLKSNEQN